MCFLENGGVTLLEYEPGEHLGDNRYVESLDMTQDGTFCFARWHCHADPWRARELAGPGVDDLYYARYVNCPSIVLTVLDWSAISTDSQGAARRRDTFNVDYFTPEGVVIDLGNYGSR